METQELRLTPELKDKLRGSLGFSVNATFTYVPKAFRQKDDNGEYIIPKDFWPVFTLKSLDGLEAAKREDSAGYVTFGEKKNESKLHLQSGNMRIDTLSNGIKNVKNFYFEDGSVASFDSKLETMTILNGEESGTKRVSPKQFIRYIRPDLQIELQEAINERNILTEEELRGLEL